MQANWPQTAKEPTLPFDRPFPPPPPAPLRTLFLSDLHLGALGSRPDLLLAFLRSLRAEQYVLVGDILDLWHPLLPHWTPADQAIIDHLNDRQAEGATLVYVRGNHDPAPEAAPRHARLHTQAVTAHVHLAGDGRRYLVVHGDQADSRLVRSHLATRLGSLLNHLLLRLDRGLHRLRRQSPGEARSLIAAAIASLNALAYSGRSHEHTMVALARQAGLDGIICGHFHIAGLHDHHGLTYANCGDWVDSFTVLEESHDGRLALRGGRWLLAQAGAPASVLVQA